MNYNMITVIPLLFKHKLLRFEYTGKHLAQDLSNNNVGGRILDDP